VNGAKGPAVGTAFHPEPESGHGVRSNRHAPKPVQLARLPRRRRPGMIALAMALVGAGILASTAVYTATNHQVPVLVVTANVPAGTAITAADIGTAKIAAGPGIGTIPASQRGQVIGQVAGSDLHPGMLLTPAELGTARPPGPGQVLVPLPMRPSMLPASGLAPGDQVLVVGTPGEQGQAGSAMSATVLTAPVAGVIEAVSPAVNGDGLVVVDVLVIAGKGPAVAEQASTGQISLIVIKRGP
jgi:hypothetical protein